MNDTLDLEQIRNLNLHTPPYCDYVYVKGLKRGQKCTEFGRYNGKCCKHKPKYRAPANEEDVEDAVRSRKQRAAENTDKLRDDEIFNDDVREPIPSGPATKSSVWAVTINSNTDYDKMSDTDKKKFKKLVDFIFDENGILDFLTDMTSPDNPTNNIDELHYDHYFENSSKNLLHAHGIIRLRHHGHFKLEVNKIRALAKTMFGKNIHIDAPVSSDFVGSWESYMKKSGIHGRIDL